uniref:Protein kinase domain-containing protein n=1 Tax=viral metagenome TaxID=1070528 RepID=A0A6C0C3L1_9ZZZZ
MVLIYKDTQVEITKNKMEAVISIQNWDGKYKKFWVNFPLSLLKLTKKETESNTKTYTIKVDKIEMLDELIKRKKALDYNGCISLLYDIGNQIQSLEMFNVGIPFFKLSDILVVDSKHFFIVNTDRVLPVSNKTITINTPYKRTPFFSPEMQNLTGIPSTVNWKSAYYSLASVVVFCLTQEYILGNKLSPGEILDKLYATKLYWALMRCLEPEPRDRRYLII